MVQAVEVPDIVHSGTALQARVRIASQRRTTARLRLWDSERLISDGPIVVATGTRTYGVELGGLAPGFHRLRAELLEDADPRLANNVAEAFIRVAEPGRVLTIGETSQVRAALRAADFEVRDVAPSALGDVDLTQFEAVVLSNVPAEAFEPDALEALRTHVAGGRGLVVLGGPDSFAAGDYEGTALDEALPVWSDPTEETPEPRLALVLVIDRSSSMAEGASEGAAKIDMAIEAAVDAVDLLEEGDILGVMTFDIDSQWVVPPRELTSAADVGTAVNRIRGIQMGTSTDLARAMFFARSRLDQVSASVKHVVLLTDGRAHYGDFDGLTRSLRRRDITVSAIAVGQAVRPGIAGAHRANRKRPLLLRPRPALDTASVDAGNADGGRVRGGGTRIPAADGCAEPGIRRRPGGAGTPGAARLRSDPSQAHGRSRAELRQQRSDPGAVAIRSGSRHCLDVGRRHGLGGSMAWLGRLCPVPAPGGSVGQPVDGRCRRQSSGPGDPRGRGCGDRGRRGGRVRAVSEPTRDSV